MNETLIRIVCDKCGRVTVTPIIMDCSVFIHRDETTGRDVYLRLCPEHRAEFLRLLSDFVDGTGEYSEAGRQ